MPDENPKFETSTRRVSLVGRVLGPGGGPAAGALVMLSAYPAAFGKKVETRRSVNRAARRRVLPPIEETATAADGIFSFQQLPEGQYTVSAVLPGRRVARAAGIQVEVGSPERPAKPASVELKLGNPETPAAKE